MSQIERQLLRLHRNTTEEAVCQHVSELGERAFPSISCPETIECFVCVGLVNQFFFLGDWISQYFCCRTLNGLS
jgi:hypothetical protein